MIITRRAIPRRTMLRGLGAAVALPFLDGMVPAFAAAPASTPARRLSVVYTPNGMVMEHWTPATEGALEITPIITPLAPYRDRLVMLTGLNLDPAKPLPGEGNGDHARAGGAFLTAAHPKKTEGADYQAGISIDQLVAKEFGPQTQVASLEIAIESNELLGACDSGYSCAYGNTLCWRTPTTPLPMETDPRAVFQRLFGDSGSTDPKVRLARVQEQRSILDGLLQAVARLQRNLGPRDRTKLAEYLDAIRDVERRIQRAEEQAARDLPFVEEPAGIPESYDERARLMFELQVLAYQSDLTRVSTTMLGREASRQTYPQAGVPDAHHSISHHQGDPAKLEKLAKIQTYHVSLFAHFLERLRATPDGDGSLLDHSMILYASGMSDSDKHLHENLPVLVAGSGGGQIKGGRHVRFGGNTPISNLYMTLLDKLQIPIERFGDSTGRIELLSGLS